MAMSLTRRDFLAGAGYGLGMMAVKAAHGRTTSRPAAMDARDFLSRVIYTRKEVDDWLAGRDFKFAKYDSELGWLLKDARFADGVDHSTSTYRYVGGGEHERRMMAYADEPCRINTYGDSFTMCHQVSDGETWQEVLARNLCEPIRNFGVGAYSVYQAYLRMRREERRVPAGVIILNIYDDDHYRNLDAWRHIRCGKDARFLCPTLPHLQVNLAKRACREVENPCPTRESVYNLCDLDWVERRFRDDFVLGIMLSHANTKAGNPDLAYKNIMDLATTHGINTRIDRGEGLDQSARVLHARAALLATMYVVEKVEAFAREHGKKVLYVLSFNAANVARRVKEGTRFDQDFVDFLKAKNLPFVDLMEAHLADFAMFKGSIEEYLARYYIGHYTPLGNFFTAFAIKPRLLELLDPKPPAYQPP